MLIDQPPFDPAWGTIEQIAADRLHAAGVEILQREHIHRTRRFRPAASAARRAMRAMVGPTFPPAPRTMMSPPSSLTKSTSASSCRLMLA
jgi:hypothetical protein